MTFPNLTSQKILCRAIYFRKSFWCLKSDRLLVSKSVTHLSRKNQLKEVFTPSYINFDSFIDKITSLASETSVLKFKKLH